MNRLQLMKLHALLAAFIFPVLFMFLVTGSLYTWGVKGSYESEIHEVSLAAPVQPDLNVLMSLVESELERLDLPPPSGQAKIKSIGSSYLLEWTGSSKDILFEPTDNKLVAQLTVKNTTWYRHLVQLHKAKGGSPFKVYAVLLSIFLCLLLISGFIMAWQTPKLKKVTLLSFILGAGSFLVLVWLG